MEIVWVTGACASALLIVWLTHWIYRWRNPKCDGVLPPGSMGFPLIGETLELMIPSYSIDLNPFLEKRIRKYGAIFRTSLAGKKIVVSADPKFNHFITQNEGKLVEHWYLDTFAELFNGKEGMMNQGPSIYRYLRSTTLKQYGVELLKGKLLTLLDEVAQASLESWSLEEFVDVKYATSMVTVELAAKQLLNYDPAVYSEKLGDLYVSFFDGLMSFPLKIPGTTHYKCLQDRDKVFSMIRDIYRRRKASMERSRGDCLDQLIEDMEKEEYVNEGFIVQYLFAILFAMFDSISAIFTLILRLLEEHPRALKELTDEHEAILRRRQNSGSPFTWDEYKSMHFTLQVINEAVRLANIAPGLFRKAKQDIQVNCTSIQKHYTSELIQSSIIFSWVDYISIITFGTGYTIPAGWGIVIATSAVNFNSDMYEDPTLFNPWCWKHMKPEDISKNFMPFGASARQCPGSDYSRVFLSIFLHVLVTKYRWKTVKGGTVYRDPMLKFGEMQVKFTAKQNTETPLPG